jgi:hypothetical protein
VHISDDISDEHISDDFIGDREIRPVWQLCENERETVKDRKTEVGFDFNSAE